MAAATLPMIDGGAPLIGHLAQFFRDPISVLKRGHAAHGKVFSFKLLGRRMNVMLGPEHNKFFFEETDKLLSIRESMPFFCRRRAYSRKPPSKIDSSPDTMRLRSVAAR